MKNTQISIAKLEIGNAASVPWNKGLKGAQVGWNKGLKFPERSGEKSHLWKGGGIIKKCKICNKDFKIRAYRKKTALYCSRNCKNQDREASKKIGLKISGNKNHWFGKKSPSWKGGNTIRYKTFLAKKRDDYTCQICGLKDSEIVVVDHIRPKFIRPELTLNLDNLMTLCPNCHAKKTKIDRRNIAIFRKNNYGI